MFRTRGYITAALAAVVVGSTGGCITYQIDSTLEADGRGVRSLRVVVEESGDQDLKVAPTDFMAVMNLTEGEGWRHSLERDDEGKERHVFERQRRVRSAAAWSEASGDIHIDGAHPALADSMVGYVRLGDVEFANSIRVDVRRDGDARTVTYRERFGWTDLMNAIIEHDMRGLRQSLRERFPDLGARTTGEIVGLYRAGMWLTLDEGLLDSDVADRDALISRVAGRLSDQALRSARERYPGAEREFFSEAAERLLDDSENDETEHFIEATLLGARLAGNTEIRVQLTMPGDVTDTNAHERDGSTLEWKFSPWDALIVPVEVYAEARVPG